MTAPQDTWLTQRAASCPDRLALRSAGRDLTYRELAAEASSYAGRLQAAGVRPADVVALDLPAGAEFACLFWGALNGEAIAAPIGRRLARPERQAQLERLRPRVTVSADDDLPTGDSVPSRPLNLGSVLCRLETSGTTGQPKSVELTYDNFLWSAVGSAFNLGLDPADRWLCCLPLNHVGGLSILVRSAIFGTAAVIQDGFDPDAVGESLARDGVSLVSLVSTQLRRLLDAGVDLSGPRAIVLGGGPVPTDLIAEAEAGGARIVQTYGMTETCSQVTTLAPGEARAKAGSAGRAALGASVRIEAGEILVRGPVVAAEFTDAAGWLRTGDLGRIDEDGFLFVEGRRGDVIVTGGENVMPAEIEAVLLGHPEVEDVAVLGRPDPEWQQAVTALVVMNGNSEGDPEMLRTYCAARLAGYKVPKRFEFVTVLPRTPSGKLRRRELR